MEAPYQSGVGASDSRDGIAEGRSPCHVSKDRCQGGRQHSLQPAVHRIILDHLLQRSCAASDKSQTLIGATEVSGSQHQ